MKNNGKTTNNLVMHSCDSVFFDYLLDQFLMVLTNHDDELLHNENKIYSPNHLLIEEYAHMKHIIILITKKNT